MGCKLKTSSNDNLKIESIRDGKLNDYNYGRCSLFVQLILITELIEYPVKHRITFVINYAWANNPRYKIDNINPYHRIKIHNRIVQTCLLLYFVVSGC